MSFDNIIGNKEVKKILTNTIDNNKILHSYLFIGLEGIGKGLFAKEFAKRILCTGGKACSNTCKSCIQFDTNNNPDFYEIDQGEESIKIEQIRLMQAKILEKPIVSNRKVYIINQADKMTREAQNCLLKTLEEPPEYITIILIGSNESLFLNTIKSRCTKIVFNPIEDNILKQYLEEKCNILGISQNRIKAFAGSIKKAIEMTKKEELYQEVDDIFYHIEELNILDAISKAEFLYKNKEDIYDILEYINIVLYNQLKEHIGYVKNIDYIEETKKKIKANNNYDMTIDSLLFKIWEEK